MNKKKETLLGILLHNKVSILLFFICITILSVAAPLKSYALQWLIESESWKEAVYYLGLSVLVVIISHVSEFFSGKIFVKASATGIDRVRQKLMEKYAEQPLQVYFSEHTGGKLSLLTNDLKMISDNYYQGIFNLAMWGGIVLVAIIMMILISPIILIVTLLFGIIPLTAPKIIQKTVGRYRKDYSEKIAAYTAKTDELLKGYETLVTGGALRYFLGVHKTESAKVFSADYKLQSGMKLASVLTSFAAWLPSLGILSVGIYLVYQGQITIGYLVTANSLSSFVLGPIRILSTSYINLKSCKDIKERIEEVLNYRNLEDSTKEAGSAFSADIENLSYTYPGSDAPVLKNISLGILAGEKTAIVGESGSGKSTVIKLLFRYDVNYQGTILIDSQDLKELNAGSLYQHVSMIPQFPYLFSDTIWNNICVGQNYTEEQMEEAVIKAKLKPFLETLPDGIQTVLSENGRNLSGGQAQRISIARAMIRQSHMILVDEATSNLDPVITAEVMNDLLDLPCTVVVVTHDIFGKYMDRFDQVFYMQDGKIQESGTFQELIARRGEFEAFYQKGLAAEAKPGKME